MDDKGIKAIIFDLGKVLIDFDHLIAANRIKKFSDGNTDDIFNLFFESPLTKEFEKGNIPREEFFLNIKQALNLQLDYKEFLPIWNDIFFLSPQNRAVYALAANLKERYKLAVLSNVNILHFEYIKQRFPIFDIFQEVMASCELRLMKPDPLIYKKALGILGVRPQEAFYTDDRPELVESAKGLGIKGFLFKGPEQLKDDFIASGIIVEPSPSYQRQ